MPGLRAAGTTGMRRRSGVRCVAPLPSREATKDNDKGRFAHLVGSIPASDGAAAMKLAKDELGSHLRWLPDGETGDRQDWVASIIDGLRTHPDLELSKEGDWSDYDSTPRFRIR